MFFNRCKKCGTKFPRNANYCPICGEQKKKNIIVFFIKMVLLFVIVQIVTPAIPYLISSSILHYKYGIDFVVEAIWGITILILMILSGNSYVFTQKRSKFFKSLALGAPFLGMSLLLLTSSIASARGASFGVCLNVALYCLAIGIAEEFLCRGWVQNEFIERFGKNRKQVILSIVLSSFIFGGMHISNIWNAGQGVFETFLQIIQATASGALLGSIYYRTKNIWTIAFLHGFYDFSILLGEVNIIKACTTGTPTSSILLYRMISSLLIISFYVICTMFLLRKSKINKMLDSDYELTVDEYLKESKFTKNLKIALIVVIILFFLPIGNHLEDYEDYYTCYTYDEKIIGEFDEHYFNRESYFITYETFLRSTGDSINYQFKIFYDGKIGIQNIVTEDVIYLNYENVYDFEVIENIDNFIIMVYDYDENPVVYYMKMDYEDFSNDWSTLQEMKTSFISYDLPILSVLGYITVDDSNYKYPLMISSVGDYFMIDEEDDLYLLR